MEATAATTLQVFVAILGSSLLTTIFTKVFDYATASKKIRQILLLGAIEQICDKINAQGHRTKIQTLRLQEAKDQYKKIGGDGYADSLIADAMALPLKED